MLLFRSHVTKLARGCIGLLACNEKHRLSFSGAAANYDVLVDGEDATSGDTSAVAPLWAALVHA